MKTKEELNALKEEVEELNRKLTELTDDELNEVCGGNEDGNNGFPHGWKYIDGVWCYLREDWGGAL